jgi:hypothetical protein
MRFIKKKNNSVQKESKVSSSHATAADPSIYEPALDTTSKRKTRLTTPNKMDCFEFTRSPQFFIKCFNLYKRWVNFFKQIYRQTKPYLPEYRLT